MTVQDIFDFLNRKFPVDTACNYDNPGILVGDSNSEIDHVMIALDCTLDVISNAKKFGCQLIITHHPIIFNPIKNVLAGSVVYKAVKSGISVISMHTNLDVGEGGVNDCLCELLGLGNTQKVIAYDGMEIRKGSILPMHADDLAKQINAKLGGCVKYVGCSGVITNVLVCSGSGADYLADVKPNKCEALITADVKHNYFIDASNENIALFDAGHFNTEYIVIEPLKKMLKNYFKDIEFLTEHSTKINYV